MKAFDLDGVLVPDFLHVPQLASEQEFFLMTLSIVPLFQPQGQWQVITARPPQFRAITLQWIQQHFANPPQHVWHENYQNKPAEYKADTINQHHITLYVESDKKICTYLSQHTACKIVHFSDYLSQQW